MPHPQLGSSTQLPIPFCCLLEMSQYVSSYDNFIWLFIWFGLGAAFGSVVPINKISTCGILISFVFMFKIVKVQESGRSYSDSPLRIMSINLSLIDEISLF